MVSREVMSWTTSPTPEHTTVTTRWLCSPRYVSWPAPDIVIMIIPGCCYDVRVKIRHRGGGQRHRLLQNRLQWSRRIISETNAPRSVSQVSLTLIIKYFIRDCVASLSINIFSFFVSVLHIFWMLFPLQVLVEACWWVRSGSGSYQSSGGSGRQKLLINN